MDITLHDSCTGARVTYMANQIAQNFECLGTTAAIAETVAHIKQFWAPLLRQCLLEQARRKPDDFSAIAAEAIALLPGENSLTL